MLSTDKKYFLKKNLEMFPRHEIAFVSGTTVLSHKIYGRAKISRMLVEVPDLAEKVMTVVITIKNKDGTTVYTSSACAEDTTTILAPDPAVPIVEKVIMTATASEDPLAAFTCHLTTYLEGDN